MEACIVTDRYPGMGVLAGVHAGLAAARGAWAFVVAADMPLLNADLLRAMAADAAQRCNGVRRRRAALDWVAVRQRLGGQHRAAARALSPGGVRTGSGGRAAARGQRRIIAFYDDVRVCAFEEAEVARYAPEGASFFNVNIGVRRIGRSSLAASTRQLRGCPKPSYMARFTSSLYV